MKKLVTHNGGFHADDVVAYAILQLVFDKRGETYQLFRTRDEEVISSADIVFDVGNIYDPTVHRYDHHQVGRAGSRSNGVLYAAAGLVWRHFGRELCESDQVWSDVDKFFIAPVDAADNGQSIVKEFKFENIGMGGLGSIIGSFVPTVYEETTPETNYSAFIEISGIIKLLLERFIKSQNDLEMLYQEFLITYQNSDNKQVVVFKKNLPRPIMTKAIELTELLFIIYPDALGSTWKAEVICKTGENFEARVPFPVSWAGLQDTELQEVSGVPDALFAHPGQFLVGAKSLEGVREMVRRAIATDLAA